MKITKLIKEFWEVFSQEGLQNPIIGYEFVVDMGAAEPVCCKPPRYGFNEAPVIKLICQGLKQNEMVEEDRGPWGAMVVLAAKPGQENVHWNDFVWRMCVSYRKLNAIIRPFHFPIRRCDDAILNMRATKYFIKTDLETRYW